MRCSASAAALPINNLSALPVCTRNGTTGRGPAVDPIRRWGTFRSPRQDLLLARDRAAGRRSSATRPQSARTPSPCRRRTVRTGLRPPSRLTPFRACLRWARFVGQVRIDIAFRVVLWRGLGGHGSSIPSRLARRDGQCRRASDCQRRARRNDPSPGSHVLLDAALFEARGGPAASFAGPSWSVCQRPSSVQRHLQAPAGDVRCSRCQDRLPAQAAGAGCPRQFLPLGPTVHAPDLVQCSSNAQASARSAK